MVIVAADFFTIEAWTGNGLTRFLVLFLIDLSTRRVEIAGVTRDANGLWMSQVARNLSDAAEGFLIGKRYLIHDRDPLFTEEFSKIIQASGINTVKLPPRSPNVTAHAERFVRTIKESCLDRMILFGESSLRKPIHEFIVHYHYERNHRGLGNRLILKEAVGTDRNGAIQCRQRLGGIEADHVGQELRSGQTNQVRQGGTHRGGIFSRFGQGGIESLGSANPGERLACIFAQHGLGRLV